MKNLDAIDYSICRMQGRIFELSINKTNVSSPLFIRRFMNSNIAKAFDNKSIFIIAFDENSVFESLEEEYSDLDYGKLKYNSEVLYWVGYIYRVMSFYYNLSSKVVLKMFPATEIVKQYYIMHTFDPEYAVERMMEDKEYDFDYTKKGVMLLKKYTHLHNLEQMIGKETIVYIDKPIYHDDNGNIYKQNYGHIKEIKTFDGKYQEAYVIGYDFKLEIFQGKIIAIINRKDDSEDKLVVCDKDKTYSNDEIVKFISYKEKDFKIKIIR